MAAHPTILSWEIPWIEEPGRLWCHKRVRHNLTTKQRHSLNFLQVEFKWRELVSQDNEDLSVKQGTLREPIGLLLTEATASVQLGGQGEEVFTGTQISQRNWSMVEARTKKEMRLLLKTSPEAEGRERIEKPWILLSLQPSISHHGPLWSEPGTQPAKPAPDSRYRAEQK